MQTNTAALNSMPSMNQQNTENLVGLNDDGDNEIFEGNDNSLASLLPFYYDQASQKDYFIPDSRGGWVRVRNSTVSSKLLTLGLSAKRKPGEALSEVGEALLAIQTDNNVDYVGSLAGYKAGYYPEFRALITSSPTFIEPCAGEWPLLRRLMENLFGPEQLPYVFGWLKVSLEMYRSGKPLPGQAFVMCGAAGAGKNLFRLLISILLGGKHRVRHPYQFMTGGTTFNSDIFGGETLAIEDESESRDIRARMQFGASIKMIVANEDHRYHRKYGEPITLRPLWRLIISLNDDPERITVLPPMNEDIADKIMLFKVEKHSMPMPTHSRELRDAFQAALEAELPAFVDFLQQWSIPGAMQSPRFGVCHYHHPEVLEALVRTSPECHLLDMIDETLFADPIFQRVWEGKAVVLSRELKGKESPCTREAEKLLAHSNSCGTYLGRLARRYPERVSHRLVRGHTIWTILPPLSDTSDANPGGNASTSPLGKKKLMSDAAIRLREKLNQERSPSVAELALSAIPAGTGLDGEIRATHLAQQAKLDVTDPGSLTGE